MHLIVASLRCSEKEIADEEKLRAKQAARDAKESPEDQRRRIAAAFGRVV